MQTKQAKTKLGKTRKDFNPGVLELRREGVAWKTYYIKISFDPERPINPWIQPLTTAVDGISADKLEAMIKEKRVQM